MPSGRLLDYIGQGLIADRPATPDISGSAIAIYWATDESILYLFSGFSPVWSIIPIRFTELLDGIADFTGLAGQFLVVKMDESGLETVAVTIPTQEVVEDYVNGLIVEGDGITVVYDDLGGTLTISIAVGWIEGLVAAGIAAASLDGLADVVITSPVDGAYLKWDNGTSKWIDAAFPAIPAILDDLTDVVITSPTDGAYLKWDNGTSKWIDAVLPSVVYRVGFGWEAAATSSEVLLRHTFSDGVVFADDFATSVGDCGTNPAANYDLAVKINGSTVGTVRISNAGVFTFTTTAGALTVVAGDLMTVVAPAGVDTAALVSITFRGIQS